MILCRRHPIARVARQFNGLDDGAQGMGYAGRWRRAGRHSARRNPAGLSGLVHHARRRRGGAEFAWRFIATHGEDALNNILFGHGSVAVICPV